jgi:hypothetical protein
VAATYTGAAATRGHHLRGDAEEGRVRNIWAVRFTLVRDRDGAGIERTLDRFFRGG